MRRIAFTIIEMVVAVAVISIIFLLSAPLVKSFGMINERVSIQNDVDREFAVVTKFIKKQIKAGKRTEKDAGGNSDIKYAGVFSEYTDNESEFFNNVLGEDEKGNVLFIEIPYEDADGSDESKFVFFIYDDVNKQLKYTEDFESDSEEVLMDGLEGAWFQFKDGVATFFIDLDVGEYEGKIKDSVEDSALSRINIDL